MRKWILGLGAAFFAMSALSSAAIAKGKTYTSTTITESGVRAVCGSDLQSGGGAIGCTKPCGKSTCDYSCGGPEGKGCRTQVFTRTAPTGTKTGAATDLTIKQKGDVAKPKGASLTAGPPKAGLLNDSSGSASMSKPTSKTKNLTTTTTITTTPVTSSGAR